jgi:hypothetical protein
MRQLLTPTILGACVAVAAPAVEAQPSLAAPAPSTTGAAPQPPDAGRESRLVRAIRRVQTDPRVTRVLNPERGFYARVGRVRAGSSFSLGPGYRHPRLLAGHADASVLAVASVKKYWLVDARLRAPRLARGRVAVDVHGQRYDYPDERFFGLGPASGGGNATTFGMADTVVATTAEYRPVRWLPLSGTIDRRWPVVRAAAGPGGFLARFDERSAPGVARQPGFVAYQARVGVDYGRPERNPRSGGRYTLTHRWLDDVEDGRYSFRQIETDLRQYVPLVGADHGLALRALAVLSSPAEGAQVPFYFQPTLGGPDDLRGFRRFRFRGEHALLLQAEYRWQLIDGVGGAVFYDAGAVASRAGALALRDLESDVGVGLRLGTADAVFLRLEGAFARGGGSRFVIAFGQVF